MVLLQVLTGQLEVVSLQDIFDFCICVSVYFMRIYILYQCCLIELKRSEVWLQWYYIWVSYVRSFMWKFYFKFDVLNY